ncbi:LOW QUALITY PROTEIN: hypothetical protein OSB04_002830 [Centaurea solstitialis]|uniref:Retroviral polymerase SH3-like domain-containing protein n=1 Tax=Centaurea solstitialis TaxID=347529 RepID=A0AA38TU25_9ASTR|nr:LOW QUALITY PROTEIN: hypothetical protein OSB04_002830 [Centaurea solstitialis]
MLIEARLSIQLWAEDNRSLIVKRFKKTAYKLFRVRKPNIEYFYIFGCNCYIKNNRDALGKFDAKVDDGFLVGYSTISKAYRVFNKQRQTIEETIHVKFNETNPFSTYSFSDNNDVPENEAPEANIPAAGTASSIPGGFEDVHELPQCWDFVRSSYQTDTRKTVISNLTGRDTRQIHMKQTVPKLICLGLLPGLLEIDPPVNDQTEFPLAGSNPGTLHEQTVREEHDQSETKPDLDSFLSTLNTQRLCFSTIRPLLIGKRQRTNQFVWAWPCTSSVFSVSQGAQEISLFEEEVQIPSCISAFDTTASAESSYAPYDHPVTA